jgi:hypothetical protein
LIELSVFQLIRIMIKIMSSVSAASHLLANR